MKIEIAYKNAVLTIDESVYLLSYDDKERLKKILSGFKEVIDFVFRDYNNEPDKYVALGDKK